MMRLTQTGEEEEEMLDNETKINHGEQPEEGTKKQRRGHSFLPSTNPIENERLSPLCVIMMRTMMGHATTLLLYATETTVMQAETVTAGCSEDEASHARLLNGYKERDKGRCRDGAHRRGTCIH